MLEPLEDRLSLSTIQAARRRIAGHVIRSPLLPLRFEQVGDSGSERRIYLKLENLQPIGSFKIRGAASALLSMDAGERARGVCTASAGNMAQGVAWMARQLRIPCAIVVPDTAPRAKLEGIRRLGGRIISVPFAEWWQTLVERGHPALQGHFIHPVADADVMAGNGTIGLEIVEDLPAVDAILVPVGGGGLASGIAAAARALAPRARVYGCEPATAAPLHASLAAGRALAIERSASFVDGCGGRAVLPEMWPLVSTLLAGAVAPTLHEIAAAVRIMAETSKVVAEGAGAVALAAALRADAPRGNIVCIVSGGCIDPVVLADILRGRTP